MIAMNKLMTGALLAALAAAMAGCRSTNVDEWRADLKTELCPARFKPTYEVMKEKGIVKGEAMEKYSWWGFVSEGPDTFANEIGGPLTLKPGVKEAAFEDACAKSGATILLAPRFTIQKQVGILWFNGMQKVTVEGVPAKLTGATEVEHLNTPAPCRVCGSRTPAPACCAK